MLLFLPEVVSWTKVARNQTMLGKPTLLAIMLLHPHTPETENKMQSKSHGKSALAKKKLKAFSVLLFL